MDSKLVLLKEYLSNLEKLNNNINLRLRYLNDMLGNIRQMYNNFLDDNKANPVLILCLDTFNFQYKIMNVEHDDLKKYNRLINNRIYGDYYKLYKNMCNFITENIQEETIIELIQDKNSYPVYKDLDNLKNYDMKYVFQLFGKITALMNGINDLIKKENTALDNYKTTGMIGLNINNFLNTYEYNNTILNEKNKLYLNYVIFFYETHSKYMNNSLRKINAMINSVSSNININNYFSIDSEPTDIKINQEEPLVVEVVGKPKLEKVIEEPNEEEEVEEPKEKVEEPKEEVKDEVVEEPKEEVEEPKEEPKEEVKEEVVEEHKEEVVEEPKPSLADLSWTTVKAKKKRRGRR